CNGARGKKGKKKVRPLVLILTGPRDAWDLGDFRDRLAVAFGTPEHSTAIDGIRRQSTAFGGNRRQSTAIDGNRRQSTAIDGIRLY
ncbi:MAG: hypothetical protein PHT80_09635, partial [Lentisphaeria bacterium]|nr:hypothetical protein [Lentisphaeria bacterium]